MLPGRLAFEAKSTATAPCCSLPPNPEAPRPCSRGAAVCSNSTSPISSQPPGKQLPNGLVLEGEVVVWSGDRLSFEAAQRRAASGERTVAQLATVMPAHYIAFDVLQIDGQELLNEPYEHRRTLLEGLRGRVLLAARERLVLHHLPLITSAGGTASSP
ncbi:hypothetical protein ABZV67_42600 [Streptomyces sp. NPDC005065]|uniref:ATP-dependent DNA ligase n=1 Tax=Streptomyces sp. NPDC005065 TaxID=3154461 RepID=UPI0033A8B9EF